MAEAATTQHQASRTTLACVAAFVCAWSMIGNANAATNAVPEPITLTEQQLATPEGQALARAQDALRTGDVNDVEVQLERARELVGLTVAACGTKDINVSRALNNLALLQAASGDYGAAVENFRAAIASRELLGATLVADALINPLLGLGDTLMAMEEEEAAKAVYERAIHVTHVNEGPANVSQVPIIDALYEVYEAMGDGRESARMQELRFRLLQRHYEPTSDQFIDALEQRAQWARRIDNDELAAQSYARMITRIGERFGEDDPRLIDPLMQFAVVSIGRESGRFARTEAGLLNEARRSVNRAERIARDRAETQPDLLARTLVRMGDWELYIGRARPAQDYYAEAWQVLSEDPSLEALRTELLGSPTAVYLGEIYDIYDKAEGVDADPRNYPADGYVSVQFEVDRKGKPANIEVVDSEPAGLMDDYVRRRLEAFIYRPAHQAGKPVVRGGLTYRHDFRYNPALFSDTERTYIERNERQRTNPATSETAAATSDASGS